MSSDHNIEELFRRQSRKQELQPSEQTWDKIRYEMQRKKSKRKIVFYQAISAACVVIIGISVAAFVFINQFGKNKEHKGLEISKEEQEFYDREQERILEFKEGDVAIVEPQMPNESDIASELKEITPSNQKQTTNAQTKSDKNLPPPPPPPPSHEQDEDYILQNQIGLNSAPKDVDYEEVVEISRSSTSAKLVEPTVAEVPNEKEKNEDLDYESNMNSEDYAYNDEIKAEEVIIETVSISSDKRAKNKKRQDARQQFKVTNKKLKFFGNQLVYNLKSKEGDLVTYTTEDGNYPKTISFDLNEELVTYQPNNNNVETNTLKNLIQLNKSELLTQINKHLNL